jgi:hypothetical protein
MDYYFIINIVCIILCAYYIGRWDGKRRILKLFKFTKGKEFPEGEE